MPNEQSADQIVRQPQHAAGVWRKERDDAQREQNQSWKKERRRQFGAILEQFEHESPEQPSGHDGERPDRRPGPAERSCKRLELCKRVPRRGKAEERAGQPRRRCAATQNNEREPDEAGCRATARQDFENLRLVHQTRD